MYRPTEDKSYRSKTEMKNELVRLLAGRVAEKLILEDISTGASNDIQRATQIAHAMVTRYGMSDNLGTVFYDSDEEVIVGQSFGKVKGYSEEIAAQIDNEVRSIIDRAYNRCEDLLTSNLSKLHVVAQALLEREKIDGEEFEELFNSVE